MSFFKKGELKLLWPFYLERFISHVVYFAPAFWILFFNQTLSLTKISILFSIMSISALVFEVPTGAFADIFGRKASTLFSYIMLGILLPTFIFVNNFYLLALLFVLWGFFGTFYSGAREAWTVDNLKYYKRNDLVSSFYFKDHSLIRVGMFLSGFFGSFMIMQFGINSIWIFASLSWILSFVFLLPVKEHKLSIEKKFSFSMLYNQSKTAINYSLKHIVLSFVILSSFFIIFRDSFGGELVWQPFLRDLGFPIFAFGFLFSASMIMGSIAPLIAKPILRICKSERNYLVFLLFVLMLIDFGVLFVNNFYAGIIFMLSALFVIDLFTPINDSFIQEFIPSKTRSTIISFKSMVVSLAYAISYPLAGFISDNFGTQNTIAIGGLFLIPALMLYLKIKDKK